MKLWPKLETISPISLWNIDGDLHKDVDLRQEVKEILEGTLFNPQRGHWVLLRRTEMTQKCTCLKMIMKSGKYENEPDPDCDICGGTGYLYDDELHLVRKFVISPMSAGEQQTDVGILQVPFIFYYMQYYSHPSEQDEIIEIELTSQGDVVRPINKLDYYDINMAEPLRDNKGRIEFYKCSVRKKEF